MVCRFPSLVFFLRCLSKCLCCHGLIGFLTQFPFQYLRSYNAPLKPCHKNVSNACVWFCVCACWEELKRVKIYFVMGYLVSILFNPLSPCHHSITPPVGGNSRHTKLHYIFWRHISTWCRPPPAICCIVTILTATAATMLLFSWHFGTMLGGISGIKFITSAPHREPVKEKREGITMTAWMKCPVSLFYLLFYLCRTKSSPPQCNKTDEKAVWGCLRWHSVPLHMLLWKRSLSAASRSFFGKHFKINSQACTKHYHFFFFRKRKKINK